MKKKFAGIIINETMQNADHTTYSTEPLGLEYVLAMAQKQGWNVRLFDNNHFSSLNEMISAIIDYNPSIAGFSTFDNSRNDVLKVARGLKKKGIITLLGGYHASGNPELALKKEVDFVICGEADGIFPSFLERIHSGFSLSEIPNLAYDEKGKLHLNRIVKREKISSIKPLRFEDYLRQKEYCLSLAPSEQTGVAQIMINKGCVYNCSFCSSAGTYGRDIVKRNINEALDEIEELTKRDVNLIIVNDLNFTLDKEYVKNFCDGIRERNIKVSFEMFGNLATTTPEMLRNLHEAGLKKIGYGIESLDPAVQQFIGKKVDEKKLKELLETGFELGIMTSGFYMLGFPMETEQSIRKYVKRLEEDFFIPRLRLVIATPTSGSEWHNHLKKINPEWPSEESWGLFDTQHLVYEHKQFTNDSLTELREELSERYYRSNFYKKKLDEFIAKHPEKRKCFIECGWKI